MQIREGKVCCIWLSSLALPTGQGGPITTPPGQTKRASALSSNQLPTSKVDERQPDHGKPLLVRTRNKSYNNREISLVVAKKHRSSSDQDNETAALNITVKPVASTREVA